MTFSAEIYREFTFEAAHRLPFVPEGHKCSRLHGHSYRVQVHVAGSVADEAGGVQVRRGHTRRARIEVRLRGTQKPRLLQRQISLRR